MFPWTGITLSTAALALALLAQSPNTHAQGCGTDTGIAQDNCAGASEGDAGSAPAPFQPSAIVGNPINLITGNKYQREVDFQVPGSELSFTRHYNSGNSGTNLGYGHGWSSTYSVVLYGAGETGFDILQSNGRLIRFRQALTDADGRVGYRAHNPSDGYVQAPASDQARASLTDPPLYRWHLPDGRVLSFQQSFLVRIDWPDQ